MCTLPGGRLDDDGQAGPVGAGGPANTAVAGDGGGGGDAAAPAADATEYSTSLASKVAHLAVYFLCNLSLTLYNKMILGKVSSPGRRPPSKTTKGRAGWLTHQRTALSLPTRGC